MSRVIDLASCRRQLRDRRALDAAGWTERDIREAVAEGRLIRLQRNRYIDGALWEELWPEGRHLLQVAAAAAEMTTGSAVFSHASAAALRVVAFADGRYDERLAARWCAEALSREAAHVGSRGVRRAREILALADGRAESPGESVSRWRWVKADFRDVVVQPVIRLPDGRTRRADLAIEQVRCLFEFDGRVKYDDPAMRAGRTAEQVVFDEKIREDELRAATGWRVIRAVDADVATPAAFAALLARYGLP